MSMRIRLVVYEQAEYLSYKHYYVHIWQMPDGKRREILKAAAEQIAEANQDLIKKWG